jgi:DnaJ-class molecular chaperone
MLKPCSKCKGTGRDASQRYQSLHGIAAELNSTVCWDCGGTGSLPAMPGDRPDRCAERGGCFGGDCCLK